MDHSWWIDFLLSIYEKPSFVWLVNAIFFHMVKVSIFDGSTTILHDEIQSKSAADFLVLEGNIPTHLRLNLSYSDRQSSYSDHIWHVARQVLLFVALFDLAGVQCLAPKTDDVTTIDVGNFFWERRRNTEIVSWRIYLGSPSLCSFFTWNMARNSSGAGFLLQDLGKNQP